MTRNVNFPGRALESESLIRDGLGRKSQVVFSVPNGQRTLNYTYNLIGELTGSTRRLQPNGGQATTQTYAYDRASNRVRLGNQASAFNPADQITSITGLANPAYSAAGSLQRDQQNAQYGYDWREQMSSYQRGGSNAAYRYNGNNLRMEKQVNGVSTQYLWDGSEILKDYNGDGSTKASYFLGATGRQAIKTNGQWYVYLRDTHGSITGLVDLSGNRVATYDYGDYGETLMDQGSVYNPYRWNGEQADAESGLTYLRNRYYQAATGRFIQRDPIGYQGGLNLYSYCEGDPINSGDPSGLEPIGGGGTWFSNFMRDPNAASVGDVMTGAENHAKGWAEFLLWFTPMPEVKAAKSAGRFVEGAHLVRPAVPVRLAEGAQFYEKELEAAQYFGNLGHQFEITKLTKEAVGADVWLVAENGARIGFDVKTLGAASKNAVVQNIRELGKGSVGHAIIDGRNAGLTRMQAISYARAGLARYSKNLQEIRFITTGGEVIWRR